ncbi:MAG: outer membrane beta-barrel family protein [Ginsengibacter sp.]
MKNFLLISLFLILVCQLNAQTPETKTAQAIRIYGKVTDAETKKPAPSASVQLVKYKTATQVPAPMAGMLSRSNGDFDFDNIVFTDSLTLIISAIGYNDFKQDVVRKGNLSELDLGNIKIAPQAKVLQDVTITASKPALQMDIDKKVFNVDKSLTSTGGTAIDVMKNIPSVTVDVDGNVQLRNASPQIFVDGRPTILTLDQIPADNIEKVELVTNPSAKFDAASTGGIINVVLKKNRRSGLNGIASVSAGSPKILAGNLNLNLRQGKFNFFVSGNHNESGGRAKGTTFRQNKSNGVINDYFNQYSVNERLRNFNSLRFGVDYFLDNRNTFSVTQNLVKGDFSNNENQEQIYYDSLQRLDRTGIRSSDGENSFYRSSTQVVFTHKYAKAGKQLTADANFNTGNGDNFTFINNTFFNPDGTSYSSPNQVRNSGNNNNNQVTVQVDFVNPIGENAKLEAGVRSYSQKSTSLFNAFALSQGGIETKLPLSNNYKFQENVNALYATYSNKIKTFAYQAGLRIETSKFDGELVDKTQKFGYNYPAKLKNIWDALFPSVFLTKTIGKDEDIQINYTRRIRRPNFWQLNPFIDINDPLNLRQGNPGLKPEFRNSFEFNYSKNYKGGNFLGAIYYRNSVNDITQYSDTITTEQYQQLNNAAVDPNAILNTFINSQSENTLGADLTLQQKIAKNFDIVPNINLQYRKVNADVNNADVSNEGFNWEAKLTANYKISAVKSWLFNNLGFQLTGEYESPEVIPQGKRKEQYSVDFAMRKDFLKDKKGTLTFSINDVFNTRRFGVIYDTENFYQDSYRRWNVRSFRVTFSYKFGSSKLSLFKRNDRQERNDDDNEGNAAQ